jgi:hypothetical protein
LFLNSIYRRKYNEEIDLYVRRINKIVLKDKKKGSLDRRKANALNKLSDISTFVGPFKNGEYSSSRIKNNIRVLCVGMDKESARDLKYIIAGLKIFFHKTEVKKVDLAELIRIISVNEAKSPFIKIKFKCEKDARFVIGNKDDIYEAFLNLVRYSVMAIEDEAKKTEVFEGVINIRVFIKNGYSAIEISHNGAGLNKGLLEAFRSKNFCARKDVNEQLKIARAFIKENRGGINVKSGRSKGSIFTVRLPVVETFDDFEIKKLEEFRATVMGVVNFYDKDIEPKIVRLNLPWLNKFLFTHNVSKNFLYAGKTSYRSLLYLKRGTLTHKKAIERFRGSISFLERAASIVNVYVRQKNPLVYKNILIAKLKAKIKTQLAKKIDQDAVFGRELAIIMRKYLKTLEKTIKKSEKILAEFKLESKPDVLLKIMYKLSLQNSQSLRSRI